MPLSPAPLVASATAAVVLAGALPAPAEAAPARQIVIKNCTETVNGVPLRVKMRFDRVLRVRVTHPDGTGNFRDRRVERVATVMSFESAPTPPDGNGGDIGSAAWARSYGDSPSYRIREWGAVTTAEVTFTLKNKKRTTVSCTQRFA